MIGQVIRTVAAKGVDMLRFVFSPRFFHIILFSFVFFASIGAAEEKHVSVDGNCDGRERMAPESCCRSRFGKYE